MHYAELPRIHSRAAAYEATQSKCTEVYLKMSSQKKKAVLALKQVKRKLKSVAKQRRVQFKKATAYRHISSSASSEVKTIEGVYNSYP